MAHGRPDGFTTLYDEAGNPVSVRMDPTTEYGLVVVDDRSRRLLEQILEEIKKLTCKE